MRTYGTVYGAGVNKHSFWESFVLRRQSQNFSTMMPVIKIAKHTRQNTASRLSAFMPDILADGGAGVILVAERGIEHRRFEKFVGGLR
jgi:hypothetical protein